MGHEIKTSLRWDGRIIDVTAVLEGTALILRGGVTFTIPFTEMMSVVANGNFLDFKTSRGLMMLETGPKTETWKEKIKNPKALIEKLGLDATKKVCVAGKMDSGLRAELDSSGAKIAKTARGTDFDVIFLVPATKKDLEKMPALREMLVDDGGIWIVYPKGLTGEDALTERAVMTSGRILGLTDNKVAKVDDVLTAVRFVIPVALRKKAAKAPALGKK